MCRLFGLTGGAEPVTATFWLLEAPDSLAKQSRSNADGFGLGTFREATPQLIKGPIAAHEDDRFAREAHELRSRTFNAHVRFASTGPVSMENTHPFEMDHRLFGHNGIVRGLEQLERELGREGRALVKGDTDSERLFALITRRIDRHHGDVGAGIADAVSWVAENLPLYSLNFVLTTPYELWALRYPASNELYVLWRGAGGPSGARQLDQSSVARTVHVRSGELAARPAVVVASERMDEDPGWRALWSGELLHVDAKLRMSSSIVLPDPPAELLELEKLDDRAAASQTYA